MLIYIYIYMYTYIYTHNIFTYIYIYTYMYVYKHIYKRSDPPKKSIVFPILDDGFWGSPSGKLHFFMVQGSVWALSDHPPRLEPWSAESPSKQRGEKMGPQGMTVRIGRTKNQRARGLRRLLANFADFAQSWWRILRCEPSFASFFWELSVGFRISVISVTSEGLLQVSGPILARLWDWRKRMNKMDDVVMCQLL